MDFDSVFPYKFLLNLARRGDRRERCEELFAQQGWKVRRQPAVDGRRLKSARGFESPGKYAHSLSTRMILRRAMLARADAVFIFEDDVVFDCSLAAQLQEIELPGDWGIFYLGCQHHEQPEIAGPGLVRVTAPLDTHAWGVRAPYFREVLRALRGKCWPPGGERTPASDLLLAEVTRRIPAYAAYPNLAWQEEDTSDIAGHAYGNYDPDGSQYHSRTCLRGLLAGMLGGRGHPPALEAARQQRAWFWPPQLSRPLPPVMAPESPASLLAEDGRIAFLFLTRGAHHLPDVWPEYWRGSEARIPLYTCDTAHEAAVPDVLPHWQEKAMIAEAVDPNHCVFSLLRAQMALLRAALQSAENRFFVFLSESCAPVRPLGDLFRLLGIDGRSRFAFKTFDEASALEPDLSDRAPPHGTVRPGQWRFHSPWILLNREAAELLAANEALIKYFEWTHDSEDCGFGTILHAAGYPLEHKVAAFDVTWRRAHSSGVPHPDAFTELTPALIGDIAGSGCFFARKFSAGSRLAEFGLHRPP